MASKVNVKFVTILVVAIVALAAVVMGAAYVTLKKSGEDNIAAGDKLFAEGNYKDAAIEYSKAVRKDQTNVDWLLKWRDALLKNIPDTEAAYQDAYTTHYMGILQKLAILQASDPAAALDYFDAVYKQTVAFGGGAEAWQGFAASVATKIEDLDMTDPEAKKLLRFRGLAQTQRQRSIALTDEEFATAVADLAAALEADPSDWEAAAGIIQINRDQYFSALRARRDDIAARAKSAWEKALADALQKFPNTPEIALVALEITVDDRLRATTGVPERIAAMQSMAGQEKPVVDLLLAADPATLDANVIGRVVLPGRTLALLQPATFRETALDIIDHALSANPDDSALLYLRATTLIDMGRFDEADADLDRLVSLPDLPVSLEGMILKARRQEAMFQQANLAVDRFTALEPGPERDAALALAKERRAALGQRLGEGNRLALTIDGKLALAEGRNADAVRYFQQLNDETGNQEPAVLRYLATALERSNTLGAAREVYNRLIEINPSDILALNDAANLELRLRNVDGAIARLEQALLVAPESETLLTQLNTLRAARGDEATVVTDPVVRNMMAAQAAAQQAPPDWAEARRLLEEAVAQAPQDPRPVPLLVEVLMAQGDLEAAKRVAEDGLKLAPGNEILLGALARLESDDPVEAQLEFINRGSDSEAVKWVRRYGVFTAAGDKDRAVEALANAEKADANEPMVIDALFVRALYDKDMTRARELAARAAQTNADQAGGLLYQARIAIQENRMDAALSDLDRAVERAPFSAQGHRLRGQVLLRLGRVEDAVEALSKASQFKPDDAEIAVAYASTLMRLQRNSEALTAVRAARRFAPYDDRLREMWLALEATSGDPAVAIAERRNIHAADPSNLDNTRSLISLLTNEGSAPGDRAEAGVLLREAGAAAPNDLGLAILEARWLARGGDVDGGAKRLRDHIAAIPAKDLNVDPYIALGDFLIENGRVADGIAALEEGKKVQDPKVMMANRRLGDYFFSVARYEDAINAYVPVLDAGVDEDRLVLKRVIETQVRLRRWSDAEKRLQQLAGSGDDLQATLLLADVNAGRAEELGDTNEGRAALQRARALLDKAVEIAPNQPEPFLRRAQFDLMDPERQRFVLSDLEQALRLQPNSIPARTMRAVALANAGRRTEAIAELREGIKAAPQASELRQMLINQLYDGGFKREAHAAASEAVAANPDSWEWLMIAGDVYARDGDWTAGRDYYRKAMELRPVKPLALRLANACLYDKPPDPAAALAALDSLGSANENDSELSIVRARALDKSGKRADALRTATAALGYAQDPPTLRHWYLHIEEMFPGDNKALVAYLDSQQPPPSLAAEYAVHAATHQAFDFNRHDSILESLRAVENEVDDPQTRIALYRVMGQIAYGKQRYDDAAYAFTKGVELAPNDLEFNNNLAYTLSKYLDRNEDALAPAEQAVRLAGSDSSALDTLGWVYYRLKRLAEAHNTLAKAVQMAKPESLPEQIAANMHFARVVLAEGDVPLARKHADTAKALLERAPNLRGEFGTDMVELIQSLEEAESMR